MNEVNQEITEQDNKQKCPVCLSENFHNNHCPNCNYDFSEMFPCPLLDDDHLIKEQKKTCNIDRMPCKFKGLEYESCDKYHSYSD